MWKLRFLPVAHCTCHSGAGVSAARTLPSLGQVLCSSVLHFKCLVCASPPAHHPACLTLICLNLLASISSLPPTLPPSPRSNSSHPRQSLFSGNDPHILWQKLSLWQTELHSVFAPGGPPHPPFLISPPSPVLC